ncbi:MAG: hypothetical protein LBM77_05850 [Spirochaetaceae bacterium]|jgi:hypothetical protein|nr:hypothetical protein [Spirochaetaceae bacterium]
MIGFLIKKTFFDLWDNLFRIAFVNIGFIALLAYLIFIPGLLVAIPPLSVLALVIGILGISIYFQAAALAFKDVSDYKVFGFRDFFEKVKESWKQGLVFGLLICALVVVAIFILPFYLSMGNLLGLFVTAIVFWALVISILALQWYIAIRARLDTKISKIIRKCFLIFFDNPGFSLFSFFHNLILFALSAFLAFLAPGPAGIILYLDEALRLRLLKYDWLDAHPEELNKTNARGRRIKPKIPWDALLIDERERTGTRSFRNFIFPWKD